MFGVIALVLGTLTPIAINTLLKESIAVPETRTTGTAIQTSMNISEVLSSELRNFKSYDEIVDYLINLESAKTLSSALVASPFTFSSVRVLTQATATVTMAVTTPAAEGAKAGVDVGAVRTPGTNVQVIGVDEPDIVKCDGRVLAVVSSNKVNLVGVKEKKVLSVVDLKDEQVSGLFLYDDLLVVLASKPNINPIIIDLGLRCKCGVIISPGTSNTTVYIYDISSLSNPKLKNKLSVTGSLFTSRMNDKYIYVITALPISGPTIPLVNDVPVKVENIAKVDVEPTTYTVITALDVISGQYSSYAFMTGYNSWLYMSLNNLYLASSEAPSVLEAYNAVVSTLIKYLPPNVASEVKTSLEKGDLMKCVDIISEYFSNLSYNAVKDLLTKVSDELSGKVFSESSRFYVFSVKGVNVSFKGTFNVVGRVLDQFSMEELRDYFLVATTSTASVIKVRYDQPIFIMPPVPHENIVDIVECNDSKCVTKTVTLTQTPQQQLYKPRVYVDVVPVGETENNVFTINLKELKVVGALKGLAKGERIYASRLISNVFYLVTYRQVDPLFAIDVSDPSKPKVLGYLKIPGFSEYLHPLRGSKLLGIGIEDGLKISLFDVSDPTNMVEISKVSIPKAWSAAYYDHHAVTIDIDNELIFIPVSVRGASGILTVSYKNDVLVVRKLIEHEGVVRTTYVNDELYTVSPNIVKVFNLGNLNLIQEIKLNT